MGAEGPILHHLLLRAPVKKGRRHPLRLVLGLEAACLATRRRCLPLPLPHQPALRLGLAPHLRERPLLVWG